MIHFRDEERLEKNTDYSIGSGYMSGNSYGLYVSFYIIGNGNYTGSLNLSASTISTRSALLSAASTSKGIKLTWETEGGLGYYIYRKAGNGKYSMVKKSTGRIIGAQKTVCTCFLAIFSQNSAAWIGITMIQRNNITCIIHLDKLVKRMTGVSNADIHDPVIRIHSAHGRSIYLPGYIGLMMKTV